MKVLIKASIIDVLQLVEQVLTSSFSFWARFARIRPLFAPHGREEAFDVVPCFARTEGCWGSNVRYARLWRSFARRLSECPHGLRICTGCSVGGSARTS